MDAAAPSLAAMAVDATRAVPAGFDLAAYAAKYDGHAKINRLMHIASTQPALAADASRLSLAAVLGETLDSGAYRRVTTIGAAIGDASLRYDAAQFERLRSTSASRLSAVERDINVARSNVSRDGMRHAYITQATVLRDSGAPSDAMKSLFAAREYATTAKQLTDINMMIAETAAAAQQWQPLHAVVSRLQSSAEAAAPLTSAKLHACLALAAIGEGALKQAAQYLLEAPWQALASGSGAGEASASSSGDAGSGASATAAAAAASGAAGASSASSSAAAGGAGTVASGALGRLLHPDEAALYALVLSLATFSREELRDAWATGAGSRALAELQPHWRETVEDMLTGRYAAVLDAVEARHAVDLALDAVLSPLAGTITRQIRLRAVRQYLLPYSSVDIATMAAAFNRPLAGMKADVCELILSGALAARVDAERNIVTAHSPDAREAAYTAALAAGHAFASETRLMLLRTSMAAAGGSLQLRLASFSEMALAGSAASGGGGGAVGAAGAATAPAAAGAAGVAGDA